MNRQLRRNEMKWLLNLSNKSSNLIRTQEMLIMVTKNVCIVKKDCAQCSSRSNDPELSYTADGSEN